MTVAEVLAPAVGDRRTAEAARLNVRSLPPPDTSWLETFLFPPVTFDSATWPAIDSVSHSFKTLDRGKLDIRSVPTPLFSWIERAYGCPQGPYFPSSVVNDAGIGDVAWSNPGNATQSDNIYATVVTVAQTSQRLNATNFNFNLSPFKRIEGILVEVEGKVLAGTDTITVRMIKNGVISTTGTNGDLTTTEAFISFGGATNLLGENWLSSDINSATSGVSIRLETGVSATTSIDSVRMTVYCSDLITPPNGGFVTQRASVIDVKNIHLPILPWLYPIVDGETASRIPVFDQELSSYRARDPKRIEVQRIWEPDIHWLFSGNFFDPPLWPGIDELLRSFRTPPPKILNVATVQQPVFSWEYPVVNGINAQQWPGIEELLRSFRVGGDRYIDTRSIAEPAFTWDYPVVDAFNASLVPIWAQESSSIRTKEPSKIIVNSINEPDTSWLNFFLSPVFDVTLWPAIEQLLRSFRAGDSSKIDLRSIGEPQFSWFYPTVDSFNAANYPAFAELLASFFTLAGKKINVTSINQSDTSWLGQFLAPTFDQTLWPAIEQLLRSFRATEAKRLWPDVNEPPFSWPFQVTDADIAIKLAPLFFAGYRTAKAMALPFVNQPDINWIFQNLPPSFNANLWPAIEELLRAFRSGEQAKIDVRSIRIPDITTQLFPLVEILAPSSGDRRTPEGTRLDVRTLTPAPPAWIFKNLPVASVYDDTMWPAIEELLRAFRSTERAKLNVRAVNEPDFTAWYLQAAEMFAVSNGGDRTLDSSKIDVRRIVKPNIDWLFNFLTPAFDQTLWPAIEQLLRSYRVDDSKKIVLGSVIEPAFSWFYPTLDAIVAQNWPAIEQLLRSFVSSANAKIRVGAINEPDTSWLGQYLTPAFDPALWPAIEELLRAARTTDPAKIFVGAINEPIFSWSYPTIDAIIAQNWPAIEELLRALRTPQGNILNVRTINEPDISWLGQFVGGAIAPTEFRKLIDLLDLSVHKTVVKG